MHKRDVIVIGGGLSGLTAAICTAQAGHQVLLVERNERLGGRASSDRVNGGVLNRGPHALYRSGEAVAVLRELGIPIHGGLLRVGGVLDDSVRHHPLPINAKNLLLSRLLTWGGKGAFVKLMLGLDKLDLAGPDQMSWKDWVAEQFPRDPGAQRMMMAFGRLWSYADKPERISAGFMLRLARKSMKGVYYVHDGWQKLIDLLQARAEAEGVVIRKGKAEAVLVEDGRAAGIQMADGERLKADAVIAAVPPEQTARLIGGGAGGGEAGKKLEQWRATAEASYASCLDLTLRRLPRSSLSFSLHLERPFYYSNHSTVAKLSSDGHQVIHLMKYQAEPGRIDPERDRRELEEWMDRLQPGWRNEVAGARFLPKMTVAYQVPVIGGSLIDVGDTGVGGLYAAGDWVGADGYLADAAMASAKRAAHEAIRYIRSAAEGKE